MNLKGVIRMTEIETEMSDKEAEEENIIEEEIVED